LGYRGAIMASRLKIVFCAQISMPPDLRFVLIRKF
jgi:hypothetical protein